MRPAVKEEAGSFVGGGATANVLSVEGEDIRPTSRGCGGGRQTGETASDHDYVICGVH
jgi:hypothetical protein